VCGVSICSCQIYSLENGSVDEVNRLTHDVEEKLSAILSDIMNGDRLDDIDPQIIDSTESAYQFIQENIRDIQTLRFGGVRCWVHIEK